MLLCNLENKHWIKFKRELTENMSDQSYLSPYCDFHVADDEEAASAVCFTHRKLLCLSCSLEKARSSESCDIRPLSKVADDQDKVIVEFLQMKQNIYKKRLMLEESEMKTTNLKNDLKKGVNETYEKLNKHLSNLKEICLNLVDSKTDAMSESFNQAKKNLNTFENELEEHLAHVSSNKDNATESKTKVQEIKSKLIKKLCGSSLNPKGDFQPNPELEDAILKSDILGIVNIEMHCEDLYDEVNPTDTENQSEKENERVHKNMSVTSRDNSLVTSRGEPQNVSVCSKDSISTMPVGSVHNNTYFHFTPTIKDKTSDLKDGYEKDISEHSSESIAPDRKKHHDANHSKHHFRWPKFLSRQEKSEVTAKKKSIHKESAKYSSAMPDTNPPKKPHATEVYENITFNTRTEIQPKHLINKTVTLTGLQTKSTKAWHFSKIMCLGENHVVLLSKPNSAVAIAEFDGTVVCQKQFQSAILGVAVTGYNQLAILLEKKMKVINLYEVKNGLHQKNSFYINEVIVNITGFDFNERESQYAISSPAKLIVLGIDGDNIRTISLDVSDYTEIVTTYDFEKNSLYILNIQHQTLKCFSYDKSDAIWRRKFDDKEMVPMSLFLNKEKLYITFRDAIAVFATTDGSAVDKHATNDLLEDCLGLCVIDDVIMFSSNSDQYEGSTKLAFIPL
ncbi:uncharacterized protein LOC123529368 [Mercenaria mercenaria]|uniref:uncharacterized protein LOC123529368 n=1 Tax=Mercenaria mercenaria TaxID=6596 RepID=UPI00234EBF6D|nr:uncharacterized protein LOC123529368 [Mercenaria mercenaria]